MSNQIIVVGGGLSGLSAAHTILEHGLNVLVIDKNAFFGGNSTKATSGINGALTRTQIGKRKRVLFRVIVIVRVSVESEVTKDVLDVDPWIQIHGYIDA